jgi:hypothetical protein
MTACGVFHDGGEASSGPTGASSPEAGRGGDALTAQGANLSFGDSATVVYEPPRGERTRLTLDVRAAQQGSVEDFAGLLVDRYTRSSTPYYVNVSIRNVGDATVGEAPVPLWGVDSENRLLPPAGFATPFDLCPSEELPPRFAPGDRLTTCLVFLAPDEGELQSVSYRPSQAFQPIVWTGSISRD